MEPRLTKSDDQSGAGWCYIGPNYFWERIFFTYGILGFTFGAYLTPVAFLFLDMVTLTILYSILFFFLRAQTKRLLEAHTTTEQTADDTFASQPHHQWEVQLGTSNRDVQAPSPASPSGPVIVTQSVAIYTEPSQPPNGPNAAARRTYQRMNKVSMTLLIYPVIYMILTMPLSISRIAEFAGQKWGLKIVYFGAALFDCTGFINVLLYTTTRKGLVSWDRLKASKNGESDLRPSSRRNGRRIARGTSPASDMEIFEHVHMTRIPSKPSMSSIAKLKEEDTSKGPHSVESRESDGDSQLES